MSDSHDHDGSDDSHDESHDHHGPPPPEEPSSPAWLPLVGVAFFVLLGIWYGLRPGDAKTPTATDAPAAEAAPKAAAPH